MQATDATFVQHHGSGQQIAAVNEAVDHCVERKRAASRDLAVPLAFRPMIKCTRTPKITLRARPEQEGADLMADNAERGAGFEHPPQRAAASTPEDVEIIERIQPGGEIEIAAFVPQLDTSAAVFANAGNRRWRDTGFPFDVGTSYPLMPPAGL
jgi:hypothetical protein